MSWSSGGTALRLTRVSINDELYQEDEEEHDVAPPDDGIAQEVDPGLVVSS